MRRRRRSTPPCKAAYEGSLDDDSVPVEAPGGGVTMPVLHTARSQREAATAPAAAPSLPLGGQVKSGQRWTGRNRPTDGTRDQFAFYPDPAKTSRLPS
jgi:hypothetical protein